MNFPRIILVGGFLGAGKTTAITNASKVLAKKGVVVSVITNDQGNYLVDSRFVKSEGIPVAEVTGGCFCCNYNQLDSQISQLKTSYNPSVIFAEFVGSCTDLIATVLKPLLQLRPNDLGPVSFSSFVDAQLLLIHLQGKALPFSPETNYIWKKQIEEAETLIVNKVDLLKDAQYEALQVFVKEKYPIKRVLFQNSLDENSLNQWVNIIENEKYNREHKSIEIDYAIYGIGEANLAWLDEEIEIITSNETSVELTLNFIETLYNAISRKKYPIGHLKFHLAFNEKSIKVSHTTIGENLNQKFAPIEKAGSVDLLINARIQASPDELKAILYDSLSDLKSKDGVTVNEKFLSYFQPGFPNPEHRIA